MTGIAPMLSANDMYLKYYKVIQVHNEPTINNILFEQLIFSICCTILNRWVMHRQADVADIAFKSQPFPTVW